MFYQSAFYQNPNTSENIPQCPALILWKGRWGRLLSSVIISCFLSHGNYELIQSLNYRQEVSVSGLMVLILSHTEKQGHWILGTRGIRKILAENLDIYRGF